MTALNTPITSDDEGDIRDAAGVYIAACWAGSMPVTRADAAANAAEIVRRVNLHDELVAELQNIARATARAFEVDQNEFEREFVQWAQSRCRALLAKVEAR